MLLTAIRLLKWKSKHTYYKLKILQNFSRHISQISKFLAWSTKRATIAHRVLLFTLGRVDLPDLKKKKCECFYCWFLRHQWELLLCESHSQLGQNLPGEVFMNIYIHVCTSLTCFLPHTLDAKVYTLSETLIFHAYSYALSCSWNDHVRFGVGNQVFSSDS